ncbi:hypothetical protein [Polyangium sp. y55x31]|uniref:hypothetical protein n=1 Tax=Polyangium sp. y55x31 TaxID=3042688 RepID=UPI002482D1F8|nr:hypothetical protein [Polyangium sp. y55x31]MDI1481397.1 hypothetical protein [Polyangium sp. y55x31]
MKKHWNVIRVIFGGLAAMSAGCGADDPLGEGALRSSGAEVGETTETNVAESALPLTRCAFNQTCAGTCVFPGDGCAPGNDASCLGYCLADTQCIPDLSCWGGQRCLDCSRSTYAVACIEICEPVAVPPPPPPFQPPFQPPPPPPGPPQQGPVQGPPQQGPVQGPPQQGPVQGPPPPPDDCPLDNPPGGAPPIPGWDDVGQQGQFPPAPPPPFVPQRRDPTRQRPR